MIGQHSGQPDAIRVAHVNERHADVTARLARTHSAAGDRSQLVSERQFDLPLRPAAETDATFQQRAPETEVSRGCVDRDRWLV